MSYVAKTKKIVYEKNNIQIINATGDGNCFYRALAVCLGYEEFAHFEIRTLIADFLSQNRNLFDNLSDIDNLIA